MTTNVSRGPLQIVTNDPIEINDALGRIRQELDQIQGLNGRAQIYDRVGIQSPVEQTDAAQFGDLSGALTSGGTEVITGTKTFLATALRVTDATGALLHAFGTKT